MFLFSLSPLPANASSDNFRWHSRKGQEEYHGLPEAGLLHEGQHVPPAPAHVERRERGLAVLLRAGKMFIMYIFLVTY